MSISAGMWFKHFWNHMLISFLVLGAQWPWNFHSEHQSPKAKRESDVRIYSLLSTIAGVAMICSFKSLFANIFKLSPISKTVRIPPRDAM